MKYKEIKEGKIRFFVPAGDMHEASVFYNPAAEQNRNISVCVVQAFQKITGEKMNICDLLSASGASGLRYAKEVKGIGKVTLNDRNPQAAKLIKKNVTLNKLSKKCKVSKSDADTLLSQNIYNYIDIDPFGPPILYMNSAARSVFWKGMMAVTATDQAPLSGTYPRACFRKYGLNSIKTDYYAELGVRILISFIIREHAKHEKAFVPQLSFATQHYFRTFGRIMRGTHETDKILKQFGHVMHCFSCGNRKNGKLDQHCSCGKKFEITGPIYLGPLHDKKFMAQVKKECKERNFPLQLLQEISHEVDDPFYYDLHYLAKMTKSELKKIDKVIENLKKKGFTASRTHFCKTAVKTDAPFKEMKKIF